jgi:E3 ubiquitin-protein ligase DOA10
MENDYILNIKIDECKICLEHVEKYRKYCNCSGSIKYIHKHCLIKYIEQNKNKIENINYHRQKIKCTICNSYIYFYRKKNNLFYILILSSIIVYIFLTISYFTVFNSYLTKLVLIITYLILTNLYTALVHFYLKYKKLYQTYIDF